MTDGRAIMGKKACKRKATIGKKHRHACMEEGGNNWKEEKHTCIERIPNDNKVRDFVRFCVNG
jgi:hypothetical protein